MKKRKRGRPPINGQQAKAKTAFSIDPDLAQKLNLEPNKSELINNLLRQHYNAFG